MTAAPTPASPTKVLVADDSEAERTVARSALSAAGYDIVEAVDGQHALEVFARERPDLVLLDVVMPRLTGLEACRILKAKAQANYLPVIMVSTRNSVNARVEGLRSGADDFLGKPYDAEELRARVEALLRARAVLSDVDSSGSNSDGTMGSLSDSAGDSRFRARLAEEFDRAERYSDPLACLRIELVGYSEIVRDSSDAASDAVADLRSVINASVRKIDLVFRSDEKGYILILPNTHFPGALSVAERVWRDARRIRLPPSIPGRASVNVGISFYPNKDTHSLQDLLDLVDAALGRARSERGGVICLYQHQGYLYAPED